MFSTTAFELRLMGETATLDGVTLAGALCAAIFLFGFITSHWLELRRARIQ